MKGSTFAWRDGRALLRATKGNKVIIEVRSRRRSSELQAEQSRVVARIVQIGNYTWCVTKGYAMLMAGNVTMSILDIP